MPSVFVDPAAPDPQRVDVGVLRREEERPVPRLVDPGVDRVDRRPVHALEKDIPAVDGDDEGSGPAGAGLLDQVHRADPESPGAPVPLAPAAAEDGGPLIQRLPAMVVRPPKFRLRDGEAFDAARAGVTAVECQVARLPGHHELDLDRPKRPMVAPNLNQGFHLRRPVGTHGKGAHMDVVEFDLVDQEPRDRLPDPDRHQPRRDIPAVAGLRLAHLEAEGSAVAAHLRGRRPVRGRDGRGQADLEPVRTRLHVLGHVHAQGGEHVSVGADPRAVQVNGGEDVEPLEPEVQPLAGAGCRRGDLGPVPPIPLLHPPAVVMVRAEEGVGNDAGALVVEVDVARDAGRHPAIGERQRRAAHARAEPRLGMHHVPFPRHRQHGLHVSRQGRGRAASGSNPNLQVSRTGSR